MRAGRRSSRGRGRAWGCCRHIRRKAAVIDLESKPPLLDSDGVRFDIVSEITGITTIARGAGIREFQRLGKRYGRGRWLKRKGFAEVRLESDDLVLAELHWYEAHGIGKREIKIKRILEQSLYG